MLGKLRAYTAAVGVIGFALLVLLATMVDFDQLRANWALIATLGARQLS